MGCGASADKEDAPIQEPVKYKAPKEGKGSTDIAVDPDAEFQTIWVWPGSEGKVAMQFKDMSITSAADPTNPGQMVKYLAKAITAPWQTVKPNGEIVKPSEDPEKDVQEGYQEGENRFYVLKVPNGQCQARWCWDQGKGNQRILFPEAVPTDLCLKIHAKHKEDEKKFPDLMCKAGEQSKKLQEKAAEKGKWKEGDKPFPGVAYTEKPEKATTDMDDLEKCVTPNQMSEDMEPLRKALIGLEDTLPGNNAQVKAKVQCEPGYFDAEGKPVLGMVEKGMAKAQEELNKPANMRKILDKITEAQNKATNGGIEGACKAIGVEKDKLLPNLDEMLDKAMGNKPGGEKKYDRFAKWDEGAGTHRFPPGEEAEKFRMENVTALLESDAKDEAEVKKADKSTEELANKAKGCLTALLTYASKAMTPAAPGDLTPGKKVLAQWRTYGYYEGKVAASPNDGKVAITFDDLDEAEVDVTKVCLQVEETPSADHLLIGMNVRAKFYGDDVWQGGIIKAKNADGTYQIVFKEYPHMLFIDQKVKLEDIRFEHSQKMLPSMGMVLPQQFYPVQFLWQETKTDLKIQLKIWREGAKDKAETLDMPAFKAAVGPPVDPNNKDGPKEEIHCGYKCIADMRAWREYCYHFIVDGKEHVDFKKPVDNGDCYKRCHLEVLM